ncbi:hypothetical protein NZD89_28535 (plasmid) [Alicyclobacillus fastidiosus]|uniref:Uncharacterized protein n=1 Tax=Alicyclobacillus fastidiosus TaxID=392011 RepID=A0ABY6ZPM6_9BACL|nr:hypothetical protein [Alicyclobacillus fastidiosus]WAH44807.1 hypothetical protein NZD89_28535 [Alicyclobacillus fastidiosus]
MGVFDDFLERKNKGEKLDITALTRDELKSMWYHEVKFDRDIADLFGVKERQVTALRRRMKLMMHDINAEETLKIFNISGLEIAASLNRLPNKDRAEALEQIRRIAERYKDKK